MSSMSQHEYLMETIRPDCVPAQNESFNAWQSRARAVLTGLLGLPLDECAPDAKIEWTHAENGYIEYRLHFNSEPHNVCIAHLLVPDATDKPPVIICLQGHSKGMHISLGRPKYPGDAESIAGERDFAVQAVKRGYAAFTLEQRAMGECGGTESGPACQQPAMQALLLGRTLLGERVWDIMRAIDVIQTFDCIDSTRIAVMGNSGGGTATIYAAALDERISAAMPSCAICGFRESIGLLSHCSCNYVPGIFRRFDMGELCGMVAPRPLVVINGRQDNIFPLESASVQFDRAKHYYSMADTKDMITHVIGEGGHRFYAAQGWTEFARLTGWK